MRGFGTWFFQRKCELLESEIIRSGKHPAIWEKKGTRLYTVANVTMYAEVRKFTNPLLNKIATLGGFVFYVGVKKKTVLGSHNSKRLYAGVFLEAIKRIDDFCKHDCDGPHSFLLVLDEHTQRSALITAAAQHMYAKRNRRRHLIEPPIHLESHRYQTLQAADWIAGLVGRLGTLSADPAAYPEYGVFHRYFEGRLNRISQRSGIRR